VNTFNIIGGILLFVVIVVDLVKTTFTSTGGGKLTKIISKGVWQVFFMASGKNGHSGLLQYAGPLVMLTILLIWVLGLWMGFYLLILADPDSIVNSSTKVPADALEKLYYASFTLSTLGVGDFTPTTDLWRILTGVAAFSGLAFITASITYFVPVLSAVGLQSKFCLYLHSMGTSPHQILINSWNGRDFSAFNDKVDDLCQMLIQHTLNHHAYPVVHYFHNNKPKLSIAPSIALLSETLHLLTVYVDLDKPCDSLSLTMIQTALNEYLSMVKGDFMEMDHQKQQAPAPQLAALRKKGVPLRESALDAATQHQVEDRREMLSQLLKKYGWSWQDVYKG
jgi:hypothetical protein